MKSLLLAVSLFLALSPPPANGAAARLQAKPDAEENVPQASATVREILDKFRPYTLDHVDDEDRASADVEKRKSLAEDALEAAQKTRNPLDLALALRTVALTSDPEDEKTRAAWRRSIAAWEHAGYVPGRMESLCLAAANAPAQGFIDDAFEARKLHLIRGLARLESKHPLATARVLDDCALTLHGVALKELSDYGKVYNAGGGLDVGMQRLGVSFIPAAAARRQALAVLLLEEARLLLSRRAPRSPEMIATLYNLAVLRSATGGRGAVIREPLTAAERLADETGAPPEARAAIAYRLAQIAEEERRPAQARDYRRLARQLLPRPSLAHFDERTQLAHAGLAVAAAPGGNAGRTLQVVNIWLLNFEERGAAGSLPPGTPYRFLTGERQKDLLILQWRYPFYEASVLRGLCPPFLNADECGVVKDRARDTERPEDVLRRVRRARIPRITDPDKLPSELTDDAYEPARARMHADFVTFMESRSSFPATPVPGLPSYGRLVGVGRLLPAARIDLAEEHFYEAKIFELARKLAWARSDHMGDEVRALFRHLRSRLVARLIAAGRYEKAWRLIEGLRLLDEQNLIKGRELIFKARESAQPAPSPRDTPDDEEDDDEESPTPARPDEAYPFFERWHVARAALHAQIGALNDALAGRAADLGLAAITEQLARSDFAHEEIEGEAVRHVWLSDIAEEENEEEEDDSEGTEGGAEAAAEPADPASVLAPGEAYAAFSVGADSVHAFVLRRGRRTIAYSVSLPTRRLLALVKAHRQGVGDPRTSVVELARSGRRLFALLFPGEAGRAIREAKRLTISPEGQLWSVPFASLVLNAAGEPTYLGAEKPLLYTYSLTGIARSPRPAQETGAAAEVFAVGLSHFGKPTNETLSLFYGASPPLALDQATAEAAIVADLYGARALDEERVSEREVRAGIVRADIVHVATHGFVFPDSTLSMASGVVLNPAGGTTAKDDDGMLQAWEVLTQLRLRARLVVLSACETGIGPEESVDSLGRLTRSFQTAGAQAVVASQWLVADESTLGLMVEFHQRLRRGMRKDDALREAISRLRDDPQSRHPYFWAPFILTGNPERIWAP